MASSLPSDLKLRGVFAMVTDFPAVTPSGALVEDEGLLAVETSAGVLWRELPTFDAPRHSSLCRFQSFRARVRH